MTTALVLEQRTARLLEQQTQAYAAALSRTAAQQAVDAALNHDLVSLQVTLQDVVDHSDVVFATIHDVENNLLVQAGDAFAVRGDDLAVVGQTAPITLHDSVAGYVTVSVTLPDTGNGTVTATVLGIALVLLLVAALAIYDSRSARPLSWSRAAASEAEPGRRTNGAAADRASLSSISDADPSYDSSDNDSADHDASQQPETAAAHSADVDVDGAAPVGAEPVTTYVSLRLLNMAQLNLQLSVDMYRDLQSSVEQRLEDVLGVYNGQLTAADEQSGSPVYRLQFASGAEESAADCSFRAICAVHLLSRLLAESQPARVTLGARIDLAEPAPAPDAAQLLLSEGVVELLLPQQRLLVREVPASQIDSQHYQLQGFVEPLRRLLERQYEQLRQLG